MLNCTTFSNPTRNSMSGIVDPGKPKVLLKNARTDRGSVSGTTDQNERLLGSDYLAELLWKIPVEAPLLIKHRDQMTAFDDPGLLPFFGAADIDQRDVLCE